MTDAQARPAKGGSRECMLCCGIGAGFSPYSAYNPVRLTRYTLGVMSAAKKSGAGT